ncbi:MAG: hypothetical protein AB1921_08175 [Thermodesulfobacteriota bacterium]
MHAEPAALSHAFSRAFSLCIEASLLGFGPLLALCLAVSILSRSTRKSMMRLLGRRGYLVCFGWIGVSLHELSHALFCLPFGHKITAISLFSPDAKTGRLGYVQHSYNPENPWSAAGNLFIAVAPALVCGLILSGLAAILFPAGEQLASSAAEPVWRLSILRVNDLFHQVMVRGDALSWKPWVFGYALLAVGSGAGLSAADLRESLTGLMAFLCLVFLVSLAAVVLNLPGELLYWPRRILAYAYAALAFSVAAQAIVALFLAGMRKIWS